MGIQSTVHQKRNLIKCIALDLCLTDKQTQQRVGNADVNEPGLIELDEARA